MAGNKKTSKEKSQRNGAKTVESGGVALVIRPKKPTVQELWADYFKKGDLSDWQRLCGDLGLPDNLASKTQCRTALQTVNVNIHQFLQASQRPEGVRFFKSTFELEMYTRKHNYFYPRKNLPKGSPIRALLRCLA
ncbi:hypothetical protein jhhlp_007398 [Lomentospora prolificans]|uniref:Uncharacterized protein n=1 Tax=Lomentospora prolificans TaxID=41688 RepID=A0A2N3N2J4_9PEZI|nr:hypothetical protein jhhlp_007398 [Lomentospora prolificans]